MAEGVEATAPIISEFQSAAALLEDSGCSRAEIQGNRGVILSPRFRSAAAIAGWDEEALLVASLVVEDTPVRRSKQLKSPSDAPSTNSRRKRRSRRQSPRIPPVTLRLDDDDTVGKAVPPSDPRKSEAEAEIVISEAKKEETPALAIPCMDRLREELSCAICLEICFEPSTTHCGHSFCKKCLKCATTRCGRRCPKCRDLLGNGRSFTVNTVLWNTIQLLFPDEIAARRNASPETSAAQTPLIRTNADSSGRGNVGTNGSSTRLRSVRSGILRRPLRAGRPSIVEISSEQGLGRAAAASQSEDAALALRLQREEMMGALRETYQPPERNTVYMARANLRAMASRAIQLRSRRRQC